MKLYVFINLLSIFTFSFLRAQNGDSLWKVYHTKSVIDTNRIKALNAIAWSYRSNNPDSAIMLAEQAVLLTKNSKTKITLTQLKKYKAEAYNVIGFAYYVKADNIKALSNGLQALQLYEEASHKQGIATCCANIASYYKQQSNYPVSLEYIFRALNLFESLKDKKGIANCYAIIGQIFLNQSKPSKALEYYNKALKINEELGSKKHIASCLGKIGQVYYLQLDYTKALEYHYKALKIREQINDKQGITACFINIGNIYADKHDTKIAITNYLNALKISKEIGDDASLAICYINIGELYDDLSDVKNATKYNDSALQLSKLIGDINIEKTAYENLSFINEYIGNYKEAYKNHVKFKKLTDSIFNEENSKQMADMNTQFEVDKKASELKLKAIAEQDKLKALSNEEKKRQNVIIFAIAGILVIVIIFSVFLFNRFRVTNNQKKIIELKEQETQRQNLIITQQKYLVEEKHREITDSINYAERIQRSFLATKELLDDNLKNYFVLFQPKDIVSGDFYWAHQLKNGNFALVTADSTGHGVPGAIMSLLNTSSLERAVELSISEPSTILNHTRQSIIDRLKKDGSAEGGKDGMDCSLICFNREKTQLIYAAANNPIWIVRENTLIELPADKMPVGKHDKDSISFTQHEINLQQGDTIYTLTDGFPDQFGGPKGKKFMYKKLKETLISISNLPVNEQHEFLKNTLKEWMGNSEQVDDITIIGIRV